MDPKSLALRRLTVREYSSAELLGYLRRKGVSEEEATQVVAELEKAGLIDPRRYAGIIARSEIGKGRGPLAVAAKLKRRGVPIELGAAHRLYKDQGGEDCEALAIRKLLETRYRGVDLKDRRSLARVHRALLRRGFTAQSISKIIGNGID
jgi:regulatory protein